MTHSGYLPGPPAEPHLVLGQDAVLSHLLKKHVLPPITMASDLFGDLMDSIISQQLSVKAAATIFKRFQDLFPTAVIQPANVLKLSHSQLRSCGLSRQKSLYLQSLAREVLEQRLILSALPDLPDEEVILTLTQVKGIGRWTAEMFLIFSLGRPDIFSLGDLGLRTAVSRLYGVSRDDLQEITRISQAWKPFRSTASRYLWRSLENY